MGIDAESLTVHLIVMACALYSLWRLVPGAWHDALARRLSWRRPAAGGRCAGCSGCAPAQTGHGKTIVWQTSGRGNRTPVDGRQ